MTNTIIPSLATLLAASGISFSAIAYDHDGWWKDASQQYSYRADSPDSRVQAQLLLKSSSDIEFILLLGDRDYCKGKPDNYIKMTRYQINDQKHYFKMNCYRQQWLNISPSSDETRAFLLRTFSKSSGLDTIRFTHDMPDKNNWSFSVPTLGFADSYHALLRDIK